MMKNNYKAKIIGFLLLLLVCVTIISCNDVWRDKQHHIVKDLYVLDAKGNGLRIGQKGTKSGYTVLIPSTISALYKNDSSLIVKADPQKLGQDTAFYQISFVGLLNVKQINETEFANISKNLNDTIPKLLH